MALSKAEANMVDNTQETTDINVVRRNGQTISTDFTIDADQNGIVRVRLPRMPPSPLMVTGVLSDAECVECRHHCSRQRN